MSRRHRSTLRPMAEMNLTPMMDLTFLLLITFIITFPLIEQGIPIKLPTGKSQSMDTAETPAVVTVDPEGRLYIGQDIVAPADLEAALKKMHLENPELRVIIRGDESANYGKVVEVARIAHALGITRLALATQEKE